LAAAAIYVHSKGLSGEGRIKKQQSRKELQQGLDSQEKNLRYNAKPCEQEAA
jgi:hypothetical protein